MRSEDRHPWQKEKGNHCFGPNKSRLRFRENLFFPLKMGESVGCTCCLPGTSVPGTNIVFRTRFPRKNREAVSRLHSPLTQRGAGEKGNFFNSKGLVPPSFILLLPLDTSVLHLLDYRSGPTG